MTVRPRASVIPGRLALAGTAGLTALTGVSLAACGSQGTIGAAGNTSATSSSGAPSSMDTGSSAPDTSAPNTSATDSFTPESPATGSSSAAPSSADPSALASSLKTLNSLWTDQGCKTALAGFSDYLYAEQKGESQGVAAIPGAVQKIRAGAQQTRKPQAAQAMTEMASDMQVMAAQAKQGGPADKGPVKGDFQIMGTVCSQP